MTIEVGKTYLDGRGERVEILGTSDILGSPSFIGRNEHWFSAYYTPDGRFVRWDSAPSKYDLIRLAPELDTPHTDADLAMALELAQLMEDEAVRDNIENWASALRNAAWLRAEATRALLERGQPS